MTKYNDIVLSFSEPAEYKVEINIFTRKKGAKRWKRFMKPVHPAVMEALSRQLSLEEEELK